MGLKKRKYIVDRLLTGSIKIQFISLFFLSLFVVLFGAFLVLFFIEIKWIDAFWWSLFKATDLADLEQVDAGLIRTVGFVIAISGWVIFGLLISIISTSLQKRLKDLQQGKTPVYCDNHIVILGWNPTIFSVLDELSVGAKDEPIVVMANRVAEDMLKDIRGYCSKKTLKNVICRMGDPQSIMDQKRIKIEEAREIIVLNDEKTSEPFKSDAEILKTILAYTKNFQEGNKTKKTSLVAELSQPLSQDLVESIFIASKSDWEEDLKIDIDLIPIIANEILGKLIAQCSLQPGLSKVFEELFSFISHEKAKNSESSEFYLLPFKDLDLPKDVKFDELLISFPNAIPIGYLIKSDKKRKVLINPDRKEDEEITLKDQDLLIFISNKEEEIFFERSTFGEIEKENNFEKTRIPNQKILVLGDGYKPWVVVNELINFLGNDSLVVCSKDLFEDFGEKHNRKVRPEIGEIEDFFDLEKIVNNFQIDKFDKVILADETKDFENHDARSLMLFAAIHNVCKDGKGPRIILDLVDSNNVELARTANVDDIIIGNKMVSNLMVQLVRTPERKEIFDEFLSHEGMEIYIKPVELYIDGNKKVSFKEIMVGARKRGEIAIGYIIQDVSNPNKPIINPREKDKDLFLESIHGVIVVADFY